MRISTRQSRGLGKIGFLTKKHHCRGYPNPASGVSLTNTRLLGQTSSSEKSEGTLSQQFAKVLTQSALSFSSRDHQGLVSYFFFSRPRCGNQWWKKSSTKERKAPRPPPLGLPTCRIHSLHAGKLCAKCRLHILSRR